jgi:hypothetical protein
MSEKYKALGVVVAKMTISNNSNNLGLIIDLNKIPLDSKRHAY